MAWVLIQISRSLSWQPIKLTPGTSIELLISRDDLTGCEMSGNKIRKLEFLLADCIRKGIKSVVTVGGVQSNHWDEFELSRDFKPV